MAVACPDFTIPAGHAYCAGDMCQHVRPKFEFPTHKHKTWIQKLICTSSKQNICFWTDFKWLSGKSCVFFVFHYLVKWTINLLIIVWIFFLWLVIFVVNSVPMILQACVQTCVYFDRGRILQFMQLVSLSNWPWQLRMLCVVTVIDLVFESPSMTRERHVARKGRSFKVAELTFLEQLQHC